MSDSQDYLIKLRACKGVSRESAAMDIGISPRELEFYEGNPELVPLSIAVLIASYYNVDLKTMM